MTAIFGVPVDICAESYLLAVKKFENQHGSSTCLKHIHFVDISDDMVANIQKTFTAQWDMSVTSGTQQALPPGRAGTEFSATAETGRWEWSTQPPHKSMEPSATAETNRREWSTQPPHKSTEPSATAETDRQGWSTQPSHKSTEKRMSRPMESQPDVQSNASHKNKVQEPVHPSRSNPQSDDEPLGLPYLEVVGKEKECQHQIHFRGLHLVLILQSQPVANIKTDAVVLWQELQNILKDPISKEFINKLNSPAKKKVSEEKGSLATEGTVHCVDIVNRLLVFPVMSTFSSQSKDRIRYFVEQVLNKVDLQQKRSVAIPRIHKKTKGK